MYENENEGKRKIKEYGNKCRKEVINKNKIKQLK